MIPYINAIIIFLKSVQEHKEHVQKVMAALVSQGIVLNADKCKLFCKEVAILGRIVSEEVVRPDLKKVEAI